MSRIVSYLLVGLTFLSCKRENNFIDLSGIWNVTIDSVKHTVKFPGSLAENKIGIPVSDSSTYSLTAPYRYTGEAVYEKDVNIPNSWTGCCVELYMERTKVSKVTVNDTPIGMQESVSVPHVYLIKNVFKPGINRIKIVIDNNKSLLPLGASHAWADDVQTNWNGILGKFYLKRLDDVTVRNVRIDAATSGKCNARLEIFNAADNNAKDKKITVLVKDAAGKIAAKKQIKADVVPGNTFVNIDFEIANPALWDEYNPYLYRLEAYLDDGSHICRERFGIRDFDARSGKLTNNGRTVFLRGKHDAGVFPLTGYASVDKADWIRYFSIAKSYGINHVRFHSWTPSAAAFEAADESGIFLQSELPIWTQVNPENRKLVDYMKAEGRRIMETYGNHPSFVMFALGNELTGDAAVICTITDYLKSMDRRHLYANGSNNFLTDPHPYPSEDFFVSSRTGKRVADNSTEIRGSYAFVGSDEGGIINKQKPCTNRNFTVALNSVTIPVVAHETGQYQTFPDFAEIQKYTGVMQPRNFEIFKKRLDSAGMLSQAADFVKASGALSALCYREEIEMALRTPELAGFQLLDLQDFPGQGTALVGILDAFMDSKGVIKREKWTEFCNDIVPLALFSKYCWTNAETFVADIEVAHYGKADLSAEEIICSLISQEGSVLFEQTLNKRDIVQGKLNPVQRIEIPLDKINKHQKLTFSVQLKSSGYHNAWNIWVYAAGGNDIREGIIGKVGVTRDQKQCDQAVREGKAVLYIPRRFDIKIRSVSGMFVTDFWNYPMFKKMADERGVESSPGTLGILVDPDHAVFRAFPTDFHADWQWWNIVKKSRPMILDSSYPSDYKPIVQVIDNFVDNRKLGLIYEIPGSGGKALVCSSDLFAVKDEPEVKALFNSLVEYLESN